MYTRFSLWNFRFRSAESRILEFLIRRSTVYMERTNSNMELGEDMYFGSNPLFSDLTVPKHKTPLPNVELHRLLKFSAREFAQSELGDARRSHGHGHRFYFVERRAKSRKRRGRRQLSLIEQLNQLSALKPAHGNVTGSTRSNTFAVHRRRSSAGTTGRIPRSRSRRSRPCPPRARSADTDFRRFGTRP